MIISIDTEKLFDKILYPFIVNNTQQIRNRRELQLDKGGVYENYI